MKIRNEFSYQKHEGKVYVQNGKKKIGRISPNLHQKVINKRYFYGNLIIAFICFTIW